MTPMDRLGHGAPIRGKAALPLIERVKAGDNDAFLELARGTKGLIVRILQSLYPRHQTEEAEQIAITAVWRAARHFNPDLGYQWSTYVHAAIRTQLWRHVANELRSERDSGRMMLHFSAVEATVWRHIPAPPRTCPVEVADTLDRVVEALDRLPIQQADIVRRYYLAGGDCETLGLIGRSYGISGERVRQRREEAVARLRELVANEEAA